MTNRSQMQTLLDEWGAAVAKRDHNRVVMLRRTIDKKLDALFDALPKVGTPRPRFTTPPPPPPPKPTPPREIPCVPCGGKGIIERETGFYRCKACDGKGKGVDPIEAQRWMDFVMKRNGIT